MQGALTTIAFAPQFIKALTTKSAKNVSFPMLPCSTSGMTLRLLYGIRVNDPSIIAANSVSVMLAAPLLGIQVQK
ncbi:SemiSWEET family sugar transporter [Methanosarcina sp. T3]|uniref:SemiSWEET family sugar transporter n=1 Tax=Methanosarcina sp. T3 TaxID=3439062 RepID=UPI003F87ED1B